MNGILLIDKPAGMTSHDVVAAVRKLGRIKKVGHAGTLDPFATGLLMLCLGKATKISQYLVGHDKTYVGVMKLGETTDTQDRTGEVIARQPTAAVSPEALTHALKQFEGPQSQLPPMFSAKKVGGRRLYDLARTGKTVEREPQAVTIYALDLLDVDWPFVRFRVACSKGTYIRTLAHDIGQVLGCGAHLTALQRTAIGPFALSDAMSLDQFARAVEQGEEEQCLIPLDTALACFPAISLPDQAATRLAHGTRVLLPAQVVEQVQQGEETAQMMRVYRASGTFIALASMTIVHQNEETLCQFQPIKVLI
ncbi:tRNA pseudouridine(55) synthase TruB [candidate division KSB3 bacterium]|uniref:tRNA pseudouridine synthase B n=1 Tax=candidate division KSB3 bacterium TaxID=2044937 RepID=A0A9D5JW38_9BACT|nr:tRNA pseudouridine(55) synthase TruB [candidate division KSB3 bacterium]MBD3325204.1 tRNA pseudouridine(55) synthase TruB [candidate division KSB3 bacterium]